MRRVVWYFVLFSVCGTAFSLFMQNQMDALLEVPIEPPKAIKTTTAPPPPPDVPMNACARQGFAINTTFTDAIQARLPAHLLTSFSPQVHSFYFFADLVGVTSPTIDFKWFQNNRLLKEESVAVGGLRWRVWSPVSIDADTSDVRVELWINDCLIHKQSISRQPADKPKHLNESPEFFAFEPRDIFSVQFGLRDYPAEMNPYPVYELDNETAPTTFIADKQKVRDEHTQDMLTRRINKNLPISSPGVDYYPDILINRRTLAGDTPLLEAIKAKSLTSIKSLIEIGANPFLRDKDGHSPLDLAIASQDNQLREILIHHMALGHPRSSKEWTITSFPATMLSDPNAHLKTRNRLGESHLMRAAASGDELAIITLLGLGVSHPERKNMPFHSPFDFDYMGRQAEEIAHEANFAGAAFLLNQGTREFVPAWAILRKTIASEINDKEPIACHLQLNKPIWFIADIVDALGKELSLAWLIRDSYKESWREIREERLYISSVSQRVSSKLDSVDIPGGKTWQVQVEIRKNGYVIPNGSIMESYSGQTAPSCKDSFSSADFSLDRQYAAWVDRVSLEARMEGLSDAHLLNFTRTDGIALYQENIQLLDILLKRGLNPYDKFLKQAVYQSRLGVVAFVTTKGFSVVKVNAKYKDNHNLIEYAAHEGDEQMVKFLASQGVSVNEENGRPYSPLGEALRRCNNSMVRLLLRLGANPNSFMLDDSRKEQVPMIDYAKKCPADTGIPELLPEGGS